MYSAKLLLLSFVLFISIAAFGQQSIKGIVFNDMGAPIEYATAALLNPADSTLEYFGFSNATGNFEIKKPESGKYLLQISFIGYVTYDSLINFPLSGGDNMGIFILNTQLTQLETVEIKGERTPIKINGDTLEYNAGAFKTQPDASVEDLLKKLPGVEVDKSGNIKAQGEQVNTVLVDGKEFFSNDPAVATKNLPADAIEKVQVYDKTSDDADFTGVDDGERSKTINLVLKDGKKSMWLGDVLAGAGTDNKYQANAKAYRFTKTNQFAALAMMNNINQFGFSVRDYIDFNGGIGNLMRAGGMRLGGDEIPVNYGQAVTGLITSGAGGLNFTHEKVDGNRFNISYLGNGYEKDLVQNTFTQNFTPDFNFTTNEDANENNINYVHQINFNVKYKPDSMQSINANGGISMSYGKKNGDYITENYSSDSLTNMLNSQTYDNSNTLKGNASASYIHKTNGNWKFIKLNGSVNAKSAISNSEWNNITQYFTNDSIDYDYSFQKTDNYQIDYSASTLALRKLSAKYYLEPSISAGGTNESYLRSQGDFLGNPEIDSLSPQLLRNNKWIAPALALKYSTKKTHYKIKLEAEEIFMSHTLSDITSPTKNYFYFTPSIEFDTEFKQGRNLRFYYSSDITAPSAVELLPVTDYSNALSLYTGNLNLKPEYSHNFQINYFLFDQFSFTSLFTSLSGGYTKDKINFSKTINDDLSQSLTLVNVPSDITANANFDFSTPIRPLKITVGLSGGESYNRGINYVNGEENIIDAFTHDISLQFDNRKKEKIDATFGASLAYTQAKYSVQTSESSNYITNTLFSEIIFTPTETWRLKLNADVDRYIIEGIDGSTTVPLLQAELTRFILEGNRGTISLKAYDLLDKNSGFTQNATFNYISQQQSNTIGRYFLLSFKYRINKADSNNGMSIEVNGN